MATQTEVINRALMHCGQAPLMHDQDDSPNARICRQEWPFAYEATLRQHPWNFAIRRAVLVRHRTKPAYGFEYYYAVPADCLRVCQVHPQGVEYATENGMIATDSEEIMIRYISNNTRLEAFDALAIEVLSLTLASAVVTKITENFELQGSLLSQADEYLRRARHDNATENSPPRPVEGIWTKVRYV